jgi:hypothetical protein
VPGIDIGLMLQKQIQFDSPFKFRVAQLADKARLVAKDIYSLF